MKYKKIVEVQIDDEQRMAISFVRDLLESIIFEENQTDRDHRNAGKTLHFSGLWWFVEKISKI